MKSPIVKCKRCGEPIKSTPYASYLRNLEICYYCISPDSYEDAFGKTKKLIRKRVRQQCLGATKKGVRCKIHTSHTSGFCKRHRHQLVGKNPVIPPVARSEYKLGAKSEYAEYLGSPEWKARRKMVISYWDGRCALCNAPANIVHHNNYAGRGKETHNDLVLLCEFHHNWFEKHHKYDRKTNAIKWSG